MNFKVKKTKTAYTIGYSGAPWDGCGYSILANNVVIVEDIPTYDIGRAYRYIKYRNWMGGNKRWSRSIVQRWLV